MLSCRDSWSSLSIHASKTGWRFANDVVNVYVNALQQSMAHTNLAINKKLGACILYTSHNRSSRYGFVANDCV